jgi:hypothetical protein
MIEPVPDHEDHPSPTFVTRHVSASPGLMFGECQAELAHHCSEGLIPERQHLGSARCQIALGTFPMCDSKHVASRSSKQTECWAL